MVTDTQKSAFARNGYALFPNWLSEPVVNKLRAESEDWMKPRRVPGGDPYILRQDYQGRPETTFVHYLEYRDPDSFLPLLASDDLASVMTGLIGEDPICFPLALNVSRANDGLPTIWQQDGSRLATAAAATFIVALDGSEREPVLDVFPGSHRESADICAVQNEGLWNDAAPVTVEISAGDLLVVDTLLINQQRPTHHDIRRLVSFGVWSAELLDPSIWTETWKSSRRSLVELGLRWPERATREAPIVSELQAIAREVAPAPSANICFE